MKLVSQRIGDVTVLVEASEDVPELIGVEPSGRDTRLTGIGENMEAAYSKIESLISNIARDMGAELKELNKAVRPTQMQVDFGIGVSAQAGNVWVFLSGRGDCTLSVKMIWDL